MVFLIMSGCGVSKEDAGYTQVSMKEAVEFMADKSDYIILDARTAEEYNTEYIPDAVNVPNENIGQYEIPELPDKGRLIMVCCRSGNRSKQASEKLVDLGYTNIVEFGGINDWQGEKESNID